MKICFLLPRTKGFSCQFDKKLTRAPRHCTPIYKGKDMFAVRYNFFWCYFIKSECSTGSNQWVIWIDSYYESSSNEGVWELYTLFCSGATEENYQQCLEQQLYQGQWGVKTGLIKKSSVTVHIIYGGEGRGYNYRVVTTTKRFVIWSYLVKPKKKIILKTPEFY